MFSLIITIISIALVAALALATLYYGGSAFNRGNDGATAAKLINEGQQLNGAVAIAKADAAAGSAAVTDLTGLVTAGYLSQLPASFASLGSTTIASGNVEVSVTDNVAKEVQARATNTAVSAVSVPATKPAGQVYGAYGATGAAKFFYTF